MIETKRCYISKLNHNDYDKVLSLYTNSKVREYLGGTISEDMFQKRFERMCLINEEEYYFTIYSKQNREFIGLASIDTYHNNIDKELSYQFLPQYWGKGYAVEVLQRVIKYAFEDLKFTRILAETQTANKRSCKLLLKLGMKLERTLTRFEKEQGLFSKTAKRVPL